MKTLILCALSTDPATILEEALRVLPHMDKKVYLFYPPEGSNHAETLSTFLELQEMKVFQYCEDKWSGKVDHVHHLQDRNSQIFHDKEITYLTEIYLLETKTLVQVLKALSGCGSHVILCPQPASGIVFRVHKTSNEWIL